MSDVSLLGSWLTMKPELGAALLLCATVGRASLLRNSAGDFVMVRLARALRTVTDHKVAAVAAMPQIYSLHLSCGQTILR